MTSNRLSASVIMCYVRRIIVINQLVYLLMGFFFVCFLMSSNYALGKSFLLVCDFLYVEAVKLIIMQA